MTRVPSVTESGLGTGDGTVGKEADVTWRGIAESDGGMTQGKGTTVGGLESADGMTRGTDEATVGIGKGGMSLATACKIVGSVAAAEAPPAGKGTSTTTRQSATITRAAGLVDADAD